MQILTHFRNIYIKKRYTLLWKFVFNFSLWICQGFGQLNTTTATTKHPCVYANKKVDPWVVEDLSLIHI